MNKTVGLPSISFFSVLFDTSISTQKWGSFSSPYCAKLCNLLLSLAILWDRRFKFPRNVNKTYNIHIRTNSSNVISQTLQPPRPWLLIVDIMNYLQGTWFDAQFAFSPLKTLTDCSAVSLLSTLNSAVATSSSHLTSPWILNGISYTCTIKFSI